MIRILQYGTIETPQAEANICPACGNDKSNQKLMTPKALIPGREAMLRQPNGIPYPPPLVPTYQCCKCGTIWQWTPDPQKDITE